MKAGSYSVIRANIEATEEKKAIAAELYPEADFYHEYHREKKDISVMLKN